jgi:biopolymer transport protein ExbD
MAINLGAARGRAEINITPLIDVVLVLLIIFMVLQQATLNQVTATVPDRSDDPPANSDPQIVLTVKAGGRVALDDEPLEAAAVVPRVTERLRRDRHRAVFFQVEDAVSYGEVVQLMDAVKGAGARVLGIVTPPRPAAGPGGAR